MKKYKWQLILAALLTIIFSFRKEKVYYFTESQAAYLITTTNEAKQIILKSHEIPMATGVDMINRIDSISRIIVKQMDNKDSIEVK